LVLVPVITVRRIAAAGKRTWADAVMKPRSRRVCRRCSRRRRTSNAPQRDGATALSLGGLQRRRRGGDLLLRAGAKPNVVNRTGMSPLAMAALYGSPSMIDRLLKAGADAKAGGPNGETMLMYAARNGRPEAVKLLVEAGADVNAKEKLRGTTALMWAVEQRHPEPSACCSRRAPTTRRGPGGAGLPRNYLAPRVNTRAVEEAQKRRVRAQQAGRTYEEQLEWEYENGMTWARRATRSRRTERGPAVPVPPLRRAARSACGTCGPSAARGRGAAPFPRRAGGGAAAGGRGAR
jgi:hypothetical protein